jgi:uncharacterized protein (DUF1330 family)
MTTGGRRDRQRRSKRPGGQRFRSEQNASAGVEVLTIPCRPSDPVLSTPRRRTGDHNQWVSVLEPTPEQFAALAARPPHAPVVMVNLLTFKVDGGRENYVRYAQAVVPHLQRVGATVHYAGTAPTVVIGNGERPGWDAILIAEYPTPQAFIDMVTDPDYAKVHELRAAALQHGDLIATSTWSMTE